ncbi:hypothetical protein CBM2615_B60075 [Cupriavidus taiwanensis]|uniref:Uncharacterized protein n=1 Tax=Cupriavidus taiwanensis TaxID=164546 RepID=A0A375EA63_9BURK|nr:hypothetical protein CBM2614_B50073 [Cupriavidus taiwanensis]SOZ69721.1 hypothetical protein CBM2615_B60075 [Cupriavidus taiwanensis]SOZ72927.1 hypothetical protein CBM2613_B50075 [Cupriavidus taiwanensis]SPA09784.1 hypothetical protein CBM2625_B50073 [Cupriavidus taiwanensis]
MSPKFTTTHVVFVHALNGNDGRPGEDIGRVRLKLENSYTVSALQPEAAGQAGKVA